MKINFLILFKRIFSWINLLFKYINHFSGFFRILNFFFDSFDSVHNGTMVTSPKLVTDDFQGDISHLTAEVHGNLARISDLRASLVSY